MAERSFPCAVWSIHFCFKHTSVNSAFGTGLCKNGHYRLSQRMPGLLMAEVPGGGSLRIGSLITTEPSWLGCPVHVTMTRCTPTSKGCEGCKTPYHHYPHKVSGISHPWELELLAHFCAYDTMDNSRKSWHIAGSAFTLQEPPLRELKSPFTPVPCFKCS